ncbi:MAG TPA: hypothetical protein VFV61_01545, partial [Pyrinomonadaceae bacterium]|nr:hypothetical protein [Pyrinomonadaceae bacterium]
MRLNKRHLYRTFYLFLLTSFLVGALWFPSSHARLNLVVKTSSARANLEFQPIAPGIEYLQVVRRSASNEAGNGPWLINALRVDLKMARLQLARALDEGVGLETVSSLAARHEAVAATNAGYFRTTGTYRGESVGTFLLGGKLFSEPHNDRAALGLTEANGVVFGRLKFFGEISAGKM